MKIYRKIILFWLFYFFFYLNWFAWFEINDWWKIYKNIWEINWYNWNVNWINLWYIWNKLTNDLDKNIIWKNPVWYFDKNKITKILNTNPEYFMNLWYIWNKLTNNLGKNIIWKNPIWYFDDKKITIIKKQDLNYSFPIWYLWNIVISSNNKKKKYIRTIWYRWLLEEYIKLNTTVYALENHIKLKDYNIFVENILDFLFSSRDNFTLVWDDINKIKTQIEKTSFLDKIKVLILYSKEINNWFKRNKSEIQRKYIIKYYLN